MMLVLPGPDANHRYPLDKLANSIEGAMSIGDDFLCKCFNFCPTHWMSAKHGRILWW